MHTCDGVGRSVGMGAVRHQLGVLAEACRLLHRDSALKYYTVQCVSANVNRNMTARQW